MRALIHAAAVVVVVVAVSAALLAGDGTAFPNKGREPFPPLGTKTVLVTSPLVGQGNFTNHVLLCNVANVTLQPVTVTIGPYSGNGTLDVDNLSGPITLNAHQATGIFFTPDLGFGYCAFALTTGADSVRAIAQMYGQGDAVAAGNAFQGTSEAR